MDCSQPTLRKDKSRTALRDVRTSEVTRTSRKRKRADDDSTKDTVIFDDNDRKFRVLDNRIRWISFLYHAWQPAYLEVIREIFGEELVATASEFVEAKNRIMDGVKNYKHLLLRQCEVCELTLYLRSRLIFWVYSSIFENCTQRVSFSSPLKEMSSFIPIFSAHTMLQTSCSYGVI